MRDPASWSQGKFTQLCTYMYVTKAFFNVAETRQTSLNVPLFRPSFHMYHVARVQGGLQSRLRLACQVSSSRLSSPFSEKGEREGKRVQNGLILQERHRRQKGRNERIRQGQVRGTQVSREELLGFRIATYRGSTTLRFYRVIRRQSITKTCLHPKPHQRMSRRHKEWVM